MWCCWRVLRGIRKHLPLYPRRKGGCLPPDQLPRTPSWGAVLRGKVMAKKRVRCAWIVLPLMLAGLHCSSSPSSPQGNNAGGSPTAGAGGEAGQAGATGYDVAICPEACGRLPACEEVPVNVESCVAQCQKELQGEGWLIPELANDFFLSLKNVEPGEECHFYGGGKSYWRKWAPISEPKGKYDTLLEQDVLMECFDATFRCEKSEPASDRKASCIMLYYRYNRPIREVLKSCFQLPCPDPSSCLGNYTFNLPQSEPWLGQSK